VGVIIAVVTGAGLPASAAFADGSQSIATATPVVVGQQEFGNTANGANTDVGCYGATYDSWWQLQVTAGDRVTFDWQGQPNGSLLLVYPVGTTDYNVSSETPLNGGFGTYAGSNGYAQLTLTMPRNGSVPVDFEDGYYCNAASGPGPYDFTVYVKHELYLALSAKGSSRRRNQTRFGVGVHNTNGVAVTSSKLRATFEQLRGGKWRSIGSASAPFSFVESWKPSERGHWQTVRVQVTGSGFVTATSRSLRVRAV